MEEWGSLNCDAISEDMIHNFLRTRKKVSHETGNAEIRALRALFNYGKRKKWITNSPMDDVQFFPVEKEEKYVPSQTDIDWVISVASPEMQDYLWAIRETFARAGEVNRLVWDDVSFENKYVVLYTRKKKGGHLTPRRVPMTAKLHEVLSRKFANRDQGKPWVFWHRYWSQKHGKFIEGPYQDRKKNYERVVYKGRCKIFQISSY